MDETKHGLIIDLNKYRVRDLKKYLDAGVDGFIFRIGGPSQWNEGNWQYQEDRTWRPYMDEADRIGIPRGKIGGYIVHNPFEDWHTEYNVHVDLLNQWTGSGYMPGYFLLDHEIATCWRGGAQITQTAPNLVGSLVSVMDKIYKKFRRAVVLYSARWFINTYGLNDHVYKLDNINKPESIGGPGKQWAMWYAYYLSMFSSKTYTDLRQAITDIPTPTGDAVGKYLQCGSYSLWDLWQFTSALKLDGDTIGVDASVTNGTIADYWKMVGYTETTPDPEPDPEPDPDPETDTELSARVTALEKEMTALKAALHNV